MSEQMYFEKPKQVKICEQDNDILCFVYGIAYHDFIMFSDNGSILPISDPSIKAIQVFSDWVDFTDSIKDF